MERPMVDYSLTGESSKQALENGLADAVWYATPIAKDEMRKLLERKDGPAIRDTLIWFALLLGSGWAGYVLWGTVWAVLPFMLYGVIYASSSDSRWHETSHGTAFKTDWMNNVLYEIASFMIFRESTTWRWSHTRHHTDTSIVGRDSEIAVPRPANLRSVVLAFFKVEAMWAEIQRMIVHALGKKSERAAAFVPDSEWPKIFFKARIYLAIYGAVVVTAVAAESWLPLMYIGLPSLYGSWLGIIYGMSQHAGLAEDVTDHRLNSRTIYMNPINRYLYWNMNYHIEHHMFPLVPYHALPRLHELMKHDCPKPYKGLAEAWKEIIPAVIRQSDDPTYFVERELPGKQPEPPRHSYVFKSSGQADAEGWIKVCDADVLQREDVIRFDHGELTFAVYCTEDGNYYATDGICTHGNTHLVDGLVKGNLIECSKHNGRFDVRDGSVQRAPVCVNLHSYAVERRDGVLYMDISTAGQEDDSTEHAFRVVSNDNVATFIKELVLEPERISPGFEFQPGDYIQLDIPEYRDKTLGDIEVGEEYSDAWKEGHLFGLEASNAAASRRNYSLASNPDSDRQLRFNVRIALPPQGQLCKAGAGSSYVFGLKPGDRVTARGPFGDFRIKDSDREMIYVGGGAGMAPMRSHISNLLESQGSNRKISFWYGARSRKEMFYLDYFLELEKKYPNFSFHYAFSEPLDGEEPAPFEGFIHNMVREQILDTHPDPKAVEYYLCGPPAMMQATRGMLEELAVPEGQIAYDEF
ncbi:NADH:ubiquinone reductase (Na(+)-transporting) subunit F [Pseudomaricurvus alkylphenolicus]|uniref:NADH:ubiquinone reductase (Na(+)-transporting) subunit F n=1 Tax=Pseudomaricurvus alkylphenolicus TaxID=1306991 RepID=UPI001F1172D5|nr:NADH:ubiquinone reductase (Na(+)-transporting) subunit F [Pseudomaricurvus alkylphenolicus]